MQPKNPAENCEIIQSIGRALDASGGDANDRKELIDELASCLVDAKNFGDEKWCIKQYPQTGQGAEVTWKGQHDYYRQFQLINMVLAKFPDLEPKLEDSKESLRKNYKKVTGGMRVAMADPRQDKSFNDAVESLESIVEEFQQVAATHSARP